MPLFGYRVSTHTHMHTHTGSSVQIMLALCPAAFQRGGGKINSEQIVKGGGGLCTSARSAELLPRWTRWMCVFSKTSARTCPYMLMKSSKCSYVHMKPGASVNVRVWEAGMTKMADWTDSRSSRLPHGQSPLLWHCCPRSPMNPRWPIWMQAGDRLEWPDTSPGCTHSCTHTHAYTHIYTMTCD